MVLKRSELIQSFPGFKRFEESDVSLEGGKSVVHLPGNIDKEGSAKKLMSKFKLLNGTDENNRSCIAVVREVSTSKPGFKSAFPIINSDESEKTFALLGFVYKDRVVSAEKRMALKIARVLELKYRDDA